MEIPIGFGQLTFVFSGTNLPRGAACTIGFENVNDETAENIAINLLTPVTDLHEGLSTLDCVLSALLVKLGPNDTGPFFELATSIPGAQGQTTMTSQVALNVKKTTPVGGARFRGRMFWPGVAEAAFDDAGELEPAYLTQFTATLVDFLDDMTAAGAPPFLLHSDGVTTPTPITRLHPGVRSITQRRRNRRALA